MTVVPSRNEQLFGIWSGGIYALGLTVGWWLVAGFVPPPAPTE